ncbi:MAG: hypothetical protein J1E00_03355 [Oscillospiraceae bacterium]|nr:hypothetical protein [Oscillospiraceae bacterium]
MRKGSGRSETLKRVHRDRLRPLRIVEHLDNSAVFADCPVEIKESYAVSDRDTGELFLVLIFRCLSEKPLEALDVRLLFYDGGRIPVPARKEEFRYSWETAMLGQRTLDGQVRREKDCKRETSIVCGEEFGEGVFLPLPEDYFRKLQIELVGAEYSDGSYETLELPACGSARRFADMDSDLRASYTHVNIFRQEEELHPIRVLPQAGRNVWLCCCGHKNPVAVPLCEKCGREKDWQLANLSEEHLLQVRRALDEEDERLVRTRKKRVLHDVSAFVQPERYASEEEKQSKLEESEQALKRLAEAERAREERIRALPKKIGLILLVLFSVWLITQLILLGHDLGYFGKT